MPDHSTSRGILRSSDLFGSIDAEVASVAESMVIVEPDACAPGIPDMAVTATLARELVRDEVWDSLRDAIWATLVRRAMMEPRLWQPVAIWTALPGLRVIVNRLHRVWRTDLEDLRSEVVLGFLEALRQADPEQSRLGSRLWWNTYRLARQMCRQSMGERATQNAELLADRTMESDSSVRIPALSAESGLPDPRVVESVRLGSLAARLGLRAVINDSPVDCENAVIYLPRSGVRRRGLVNVRGNVSGDVA